MDCKDFINAANSKHAAPGLPELDPRDLPELARFTGYSPSHWLNHAYTERDLDNPQIKEFLQNKGERIQGLQKERACLSCKEKFTPAGSLELYLYCELRFPPPADYCPKCLARIQQLMDSRESAENMRC